MCPHAAKELEAAILESGQLIGIKKGDLNQALGTLSRKSSRQRACGNFPRQTGPSPGLSYAGGEAQLALRLSAVRGLSC